MVKTLKHRAEVICSDADHLRAEKKTLKSTFQGNGYPDWAFQSHKSRRANKDQVEESRGFVSIPYVEGLSEPLGRILGSTGVKVAMKPHKTLKQVLVRPKDKVTDEEKSGVVYQINCKECEASYIGQTGRNFQVRLKEYKRATERGNTVESGIAEHACNTGHRIDWEAHILDQDPN